MLFENRKQVSAEDLMRKYATYEDYKKIEKKPSFEADKSRKKIDRVNGGVVKVNKANKVRSSFMATDKTTRLKVEIRYASSNNTKIVGDRVIDDFEPRYVDMNGATVAFSNDIDLAVYFFLHPNNSLSPLRDDKSKAKPKYEYIDTKKRSQAKIASIDALGQAMEHSRNLSEEKVVILAKGLGIKGIEKKDAEDVRADLMEFAMKYPKIYNEKSASRVTFSEGRILNLVDKGIIKLVNVGSIRRWMWTAGEREGEHILDIQNVTQDAKQALKNFFFNDINTYSNLLESLSDSTSARQKAENALRDAEVVYTGDDRVVGDNLPPHLKSQSQITETVTEFELPKDNAEAMALLTEIRNDGKNASWPQVANFMGAIESGAVTKDNYAMWAKKEFKWE